LTARKSTPETKAPALLTIGREEAREKIIDRIDKGKAIVGAEINTQNAFESMKQEYYKWDEYNEELLKRIFSTDELKDEYRGFFGSMFAHERSWFEELNDYRKSISEKIRLLESMVERLELIPIREGVSTNTIGGQKSITVGNRVFVVHGHDNEARETIARYIERLGLEPIILNEKANEGKTIIEKFERHSDVGFAVVILTPDDVGNTKDKSSELNHRARQNVILELGYFAGKLTRARVCPLYKGDVELPSDIHGLIYTPIDDHGGWKILLARELKAAGFNIDMNKAI
jgi:predicted nucleotide-binding protein